VGRIYSVRDMEAAWCPVSELSHYTMSPRVEACQNAVGYSCLIVGERKAFYIFHHLYQRSSCLSLFISYTLDLFHSQHSSNLTPFPPNTSNALPIVKSTLPPLKLSTNSKSCKLRPPPAYVTGIEDHSESLRTRSSSMPCWRPSLSAAWMRNSEQ